MKRSLSVAPARAGLAAIAIALALAGCDRSGKQDNASANASSNTTTTAAGNTSAGAAPTLSANTGTPPKPANVHGNPALAAEMQQAAQVLSASLPIRIDPMTQVTALRTDGTEFVYEVNFSQAIPGERVEDIRRMAQTQNQSSLCANPQVASFIRRGGSMNHRFSDTGGFKFETRVTTC